MESVPQNAEEDRVNGCQGNSDDPLLGVEVVLLSFALGWALVPCCRYASAPSRSVGQLRRLCSLPLPVWCHYLAQRPCGMCSAGVASGPAGLGCLDDHSGPATSAQPSRTVALSPVLAVLMVAAVGGGYETVRESLDARIYPIPGQLVDVGGHRMHLHCTGTGSPTVVLEPGQGGASSDSGWVASAVARDSTVCV